MSEILRFIGAALCVAAGAATAHLAVLDQAGPLAIPFVILCVIGAGLSLWGRFDVNEIGSLLAKLGAAAHDVAGTAAKLSALVSGTLFFAGAAVMARIAYLILTSVLSNFMIVEVAAWCIVAGAALCCAKGAADWSVTFNAPPKLENEKAHGRASKASQARAKSRARGAMPKPPWADRGHTD